MNTSCALIILAAGGSGRYGAPKQLLPYGKSNLLQHVIGEAKKSELGPVIVVLGAHATAILDVIDTTAIDVVINDKWMNGMASSIVSGIASVSKQYAPDAVILLTCDQPFVSESLLKELWHVHLETGKPIVGSGYDDTLGPPVLFHRSLINELQELSGDRGAKKIITADLKRVATVSFPRGSCDIDTRADYTSLGPS